MEGDGFTFAEQRDYLAAKEERLRSAILTADEDGARRLVIKKAVEDWWACVAELFELYQTQAEEQRAVEPMPIGFLTVMARMSRLIAKNRLPNVMRFAELRKASFRHDADIAAAIVFVEAARLQKVAEKEPVRLVAWAFGVSERYVTGWIKDKRRYLPGYRAETDPGRIENAMLQAGSRYRRNKKGFSDEEELTEQK